MTNNTNSCQQVTVCYVCNTNCSVEYLEGVGYVPLFLVGLILNIAALRAFIAKWGRWTDTDIYMLNLAAADFSLILFLPFRIVDAFTCLERTGLCTFLISTHYINMYASIMTVTAISIHRYLAVRFPLHTRAWRLKKKVACVVCMVIWVTVVSICLRFIGSNVPDKLLNCYERRKDSPLKLEFVVVLEVLGYLIPLLIIMFCSTKTILTLLKDKEGDESTTGGKKSIIGIVTANMVVFIVCYTPIHVGFLLRYLVNSNAVDLFWQVSEWIATTNCCLDSISYYYLLKRFYVGSKGKQTY